MKLPKCETCGKKMKLICPNDWNKKDEKAFILGRADMLIEIKAIVKDFADYYGVLDSKKLLRKMEKLK